MRKIIKDRQIVTDDWQHLKDEAVLPATGNITVSITRWQKQHASLRQHEGSLGVRLSGDDPLEDIVADLPFLQIVVLQFPVFTDGRCYSYARLLRERYHFAGEIRAQGDVLQDQLFYMSQCGINSFELASAERLAEALTAFDAFSENYQSTVLRPDPLYRRR